MGLDAAQLLARQAKFAARAFTAAGICSAAGAETSATSDQLAEFNAVLDMIMGDACDHLCMAVVRASPACPPAIAEAAAREFLGAWGQSTAAEGLLCARGDEPGLAQIREDRKRLLARLLRRAVDCA